MEGGGGGAATAAESTFHGEAAQRNIVNVRRGWAASSFFFFCLSPASERPANNSSCCCCCCRVCGRRSAIYTWWQLTFKTGFRIQPVPRNTVWQVRALGWAAQASARGGIRHHEGFICLLRVCRNQDNHNNGHNNCTVFNMSHLLFSLFHFICLALKHNVACNTCR